MEIEYQKSEEKIEQENDILGSFKFEKGNDNEKKARNAVRRKTKTEEYTQGLKERGENESTEAIAESKKREPSEKRTRKQKVTPTYSTADEEEGDMPPPKTNSSQKGKKKVVSDTKKIKDELKEKQLEDVSKYLFNYLKEPKTNLVNKASLKKCFKGLLIDNITEEQAEMMLNFPNLDPKNIEKMDLNYEDFKSVVKLCNFKFDVDGNLL